MGNKRYRGPVETVEQAKMAGAVLVITFQRCSRWRNVWAYRLCEKKQSLGDLPLRKAVGGFYYRGCRASVQVVMTPEGPWQ